MIDQSVLQEVNDYLTDERQQRYIRFCEYVVAHCNSIKAELGPNVVSRVYSRLDKQAGDQLKSKLKIAKKVVEGREKNSSFSPSDVRDVIGVTLVVQYPDQIDEIVSKLMASIDPKEIKISRENIERPGYYATHLDIFSEFEFRHLFCELQVKTMLHDAWSAKMHDLNYKPSGSLDTRLDRLMLSLGSSLQGIEMQSETIRNLIQERWQHERLWRVYVGKATIDQLRAWSAKQGLFDADCDSLFKQIDEAHEGIESWRKGVDTLADFTRRVSNISRGNLRSAWWISAYLAVHSGRQENMDFAVELANEWVRSAWRSIIRGDEDIDPAEVWFAPMACQAAGHSEAAIELSEFILNEAGVTFEAELLPAKFNLAHYLLEKEYFLPSKPEKKSKLKARVRNLLVDCDELRASDASSFHDVEGLEAIVFGTDPDLVRKGIDLVERGKTECLPEDKEFASRVFELHARMGWRRLAELENSSVVQQSASFR